MRLVINGQIEQIQYQALFRVAEALQQKVLETIEKGSRDAEEWIEEMQTPSMPCHSASSIPVMHV